MVWMTWISNFSGDCQCPCYWPWHWEWDCHWDWSDCGWLLVLLVTLLVALPLAIFELLVGSFLGFGFTFFATISDLMGRATSFPLKATHVPTFYVPSHQYSKLWHVVLLMVLGTIFGAIHCAGWNLPFPTSAEHKLWRVASVAVTILPTALVDFPIAFAIYMFLWSIALLIVVGLVVLVSHALSLISRVLGLTIISDFFNNITNTISNRISNRISQILEYGLNFNLIAMISSTLSDPRGEAAVIVYGYASLYFLMYASARLVLLGLALALLRHQPPSAFIAVDWTKFYAHIL